MSHCLVLGNICKKYDRSTKVLPALGKMSQSERVTVYSWLIYLLNNYFMLRITAGLRQTPPHNFQ